MALEQRLDKLYNYMEEKEMDLLMITSPVNIGYFTGFFSNPHERFMALVLDSKRSEPYLFVPLLDLEAAENQSNVRNIVTVSDSENPFQVLYSKIGRHISSIGVEKNQVSMTQHESLEEMFANVDWIDIKGFITSLRLRKSPKEIEKINKAIQMVEEVMAEGIKRAKIGMTEIELLAELEYQMRKVGSDGPSFDTMVLTGKRSSLPHGVPGQTPIKNNDFLLIDMGVQTEGYCSDITRTFIVGEGTSEQQKIYNIVLEANRKAISSVKNGSPLSQVDSAAREWIRQSGYGDFFNNRVGHGMGLEVHEEPSVHEKNSELISPGMVFTIEPGIYLPQLGGVRIEDNIHVDDEGEAKLLTSFPKELQWL